MLTCVVKLFTADSWLQNYMLAQMFYLEHTWSYTVNHQLVHIDKTNVTLASESAEKCKLPHFNTSTRFLRMQKCAVTQCLTEIEDCKGTAMT